MDQLILKYFYSLFGPTTKKIYIYKYLLVRIVWTQPIGNKVEGTKCQELSVYAILNYTHTHTHTHTHIYIYIWVLSPILCKLSDVTLNCIWWWGFSLGEVGNVDYLFITITPRSTQMSFICFLKWRIKLRGLFIAKAILIEEQQWYNLTHSCGVKKVHNFL